MWRAAFRFCGRGQNTVSLACIRQASQTHPQSGVTNELFTSYQTQLPLLHTALLACAAKIHPAALFAGIHVRSRFFGRHGSACDSRRTQTSRTNRGGRNVRVTPPEVVGRGL